MQDAYPSLAMFTHSIDTIEALLAELPSETVPGATLAMVVCMYGFWPLCQQNVRKGLALPQAGAGDVSPSGQSCWSDLRVAAPVLRVCAHTLPASICHPYLSHGGRMHLELDVIDDLLNRSMCLLRFRYPFKCTGFSNGCTGKVYYVLVH